MTDTLQSWRSIVGDEVVPFRVAKPKWDLSFDIEEDMKTRVVHGNVEWEFSIDTAHLWSSLLGTLLKILNDQIVEYRHAPLKHRREPVRYLESLVEEISYLYGSLFLLMVNYKRVVNALLAIPSLASSFLRASE